MKEQNKHEPEKIDLLEIVEEPTGKKDEETLSECCCAPSFGEVFEDEGVCSDCKEHTVFIEASEIEHDCKSGCTCGRGNDDF
jgi:hypothetical protein